MGATPDVSSWSPAQVAEWLNGIGLGHLKEPFIKNGVSGQDLLALSDDDLAAYLQANPLQVRKLRNEISKISGVTPAPPAVITKENDLKDSPYAPAAAIPAPGIGAPVPAPTVAADFQGGGGGAVAPSNFPYESLPRAVNALSTALIVLYPIMILFSIIAFGVYAGVTSEYENWGYCRSDIYCSLGVALVWFTVAAAAILTTLQVIMKKNSMAFIAGVCIACQTVSAVFMALWLIFNAYQTNDTDFSYGYPERDAVYAFEWLVFILWVATMIVSIIQLAMVQRHVHYGSGQPQGASPFTQFQGINAV